MRIDRQRSSVADLLSMQNGRAFVDAIARLSHEPSASEARQLARHLLSITSPTAALKVAVVHTYTSDLLDPWFELQAALDGLAIEMYHAPYGLNLMEAQQGSALSRHQPDLMLLMMQRGDLHPALRHPVVTYREDEQKRIGNEAVGNLSEIVGHFREVLSGQIIVTILPAVQPPGLGLYDLQALGSESSWWASFKKDLAARFHETARSTMLLDLDELLADVGRKSFFDLRFWYSARFPFSAVAAREFARRIVTVGVALKRPRAKVIVVDGDNTLWGGVVGEEGMEGIQLGPEYPGNTYVDFQLRLLEFQQRGFILSLCSKNNTADVDEVLERHPHQVLRNEAFAARRINWEPKSQNLVSIAEELNLGLDSFIFVDDSDYECELVRRELPQVLVVQVPSRPVDIPSTLDRVARLEITSLTAEDRAKTQLYVQERQRRELKDQNIRGGTDINGYLRSLGMEMTIEINSKANLARLAQLTQKTNQFNLTTRRYTEEEISRRIADKDWVVASFTLADKFGHSGIVGLAMVQHPADRDGEIDTYLMSCRVIGRQAESAFLEALLSHLLELGCKAVVGEYLPTRKNGIVAEFLPDHRFEKLENGSYRRDLTAAPPLAASAFPIDIHLCSKAS